MGLPQAEHAVIEPRKFRDYLLSPAHPVGRFKAGFFATLGYTADAWGTLSVDLRRHAIDGEVIGEGRSPFGHKFEVSGLLTGPNGKAAVVVGVWIILSEEDFPRFVTAYPGARP